VGQKGHEASFAARALSGGLACLTILSEGPGRNRASTPGGLRAGLVMTSPGTNSDGALLPVCRPRGQNHGDGCYPSASLGRRKSSARCAVPSTRTLTGHFSLKYSFSPLPRSFFERCSMKNFRRSSARILASRKECYAQKNRSAQ